MKYLSTRICAKPKALNDGLHISYDFEIWASTEKYNKIVELYYDQYGCIIEDQDTEHFQPKNSLSLNYSEENFYPCILKVDDFDEWIEGYGFEPDQAIYENADLVSIGYDVMDTTFMSAQYHGTYVDLGSHSFQVNQFGLLNSMLVANELKEQNNYEIPEHNWKLVQILINRNTYIKFLS